MFQAMQREQGVDDVVRCMPGEIDVTQPAVGDMSTPNKQQSQRGQHGEQVRGTTQLDFPNLKLGRNILPTLGAK